MISPDTSVERRRPRRAALEHLDDVEAERRFDQRARRARLRLNAASSNAGVICPFGKNPRSPPFCALPVSDEFARASVAKSPPARIVFSTVAAFVFASAFCSDARVLRHADQDVRRVDAVALLETVRVLIVEPLHFGIRHATFELTSVSITFATSRLVLACAFS